jgi:hypothetical protein
MRGNHKQLINLIKQTSIADLSLICLIRCEALLTFFDPADLEDDRIFRIGATKVAHPCFFFPRDIASESQGSDEREKRVECPVAKFRWRKMFKDKFVPHLQTKRTFPFFQNSYHLYFDFARKTHTKIFSPFDCKHLHMFVTDTDMSPFGDSPVHDTKISQLKFGVYFFIRLSNSFKLLTAIVSVGSRERTCSHDCLAFP